MTENHMQVLKSRYP